MTKDPNYYAVYGTLRNREPNARLWQGLAYRLGISIVEGYRLVSNGGFPYAIPAPDQISTVEIIKARPGAEVVLRARLDHLEGYPDFYTRVVVPVALGDKTIDCWLYTPTQPDDFADLPEVFDNDWSVHLDRIEDAAGNDHDAFVGAWRI